jgi:integrase
LEAWLALRGREDGPVFTRLDHARQGAGERLTGNAIWVRVKRAVARIGLDPQQYGPHSLRAGLITAAGQAGVSHLVIARQSGHKSLDCLQRYFRPDLFGANAAGMVGL